MLCCGVVTDLSPPLEYVCEFVRVMRNRWGPVIGPGEGIAASGLDQGRTIAFLNLQLALTFPSFTSTAAPNKPASTEFCVVREVCK